MFELTFSKPIAIAIIAAGVVLTAGGVDAPVVPDLAWSSSSISAVVAPEKWSERRDERAQGPRRVHAAVHEVKALR